VVEIILYKEAELREAARIHFNMYMPQVIAASMIFQIQTAQFLLFPQGNPVTLYRGIMTTLDNSGDGASIGLCPWIKTSSVLPRLDRL
jgi:hypothetical protein